MKTAISLLTFSLLNYGASNRENKHVSRIYGQFVLQSACRRSYLLLNPRFGHPHAVTLPTNEEIRHLDHHGAPLYGIHSYLPTLS